MSYSIQTFRKKHCEKACNGLNFYVMMTSLHLSHVTNIYIFVSTSMRPITDHLGEIADQNSLDLP